MKRFKFKLEKLLELRAFYEKTAKMDFGIKLKQAHEIENAIIINADDTRTAAATLFVSADRRFLNPGDLIAGQVYINRLQVERSKLEEALVRADKEKEAARVRYTETRRSREIVDKLKQRSSTEHYHEAMLAEVAELDDFALSREAQKAAARAQTADLGAGAAGAASE